MSFNNTKTPTKSICKAKWQVPMRPHPRAGVMQYYLEGELKEKFCKLFPIHSNRRLIKWFGISFSTIQRFRREFGLEKDMKAIHKELARDVKRINKRSGLYESFRNRRPSEATIEATRRMRAEGFNPMVVCRERNPRKYRQSIRKRVEVRKETIRKERARILFGLPQRTKIRICFNPLTKRAAQQKWVMIHQCNYFPDPDHTSCVCYDSETKRSARREATAARHGLRVVAADE